MKRLWGMLGSLALALAILCVSASGALASYIACNKSHETIWVSLAFYDTDNTWTTQGWWSMVPGECKTIYGPDLSNTRYYLYANGSTGKQWQANYAFCVDPVNAYKIYHADYTADCGSNVRYFFSTWVPDRVTGVIPKSFTYTFTPNNMNLNDPRA